MRRALRILLILLLLPPLMAGVMGWLVAPNFLHPVRRPLTPDLIREADASFLQTHSQREDFQVTAADGVILRGWKVRPPDPNGSWVLVFHGVADNRVGVTGQAELLLRAGYSVVMMDARAHGESGGRLRGDGFAGLDGSAPEHFERPLLHAVRPGRFAAVCANFQALLRSCARRSLDGEPADQGKDGTNPLGPFAAAATLGDFLQQALSVRLGRNLRVNARRKLKVGLVPLRQPVPLLPLQSKAKFFGYLLRGPSRKRRLFVTARGQHYTAQRFAGKDRDPQTVAHAHSRTSNQTMGIFRQVELGGLAGG